MIADPCIRLQVVERKRVQRPVRDLVRRARKLAHSTKEDQIVIIDKTGGAKAADRDVGGPCPGRGSEIEQVEGVGAQLGRRERLGAVAQTATSDDNQCVAG